MRLFYLSGIFTQQLHNNLEGEVTVPDLREEKTHHGGHLAQMDLNCMVLK